MTTNGAVPELPELSTGVWVHAMLARLVKLHGGELTVVVQCVPMEKVVYTAELSFMFDKTRVVMAQGAASLRTAMLLLTKQAEAWESSR